MKICILSTLFLRYTNDTRGLSVYELAKHLITEGHEVVVVAPNDHGYNTHGQIGGIRIRRFNYFFPPSLQVLAYGSGIPTNVRHSFLARLQIPFFALSYFFVAYKEAKKADVLFAQWIPSGIVAVLLGKLLKKKNFVDREKDSREKRYNGPHTPILIKKY